MDNNENAWEIKLVILKHEECVRLIIENITNLGVNTRSKQVKAKRVERRKINENEVTKEALNEMNINEIMQNVLMYEAEVAQSISGEALSITTV